MSLIEVKDVELYLGRGFDEGERERCARAINDAVGELESFLRRTLAADTDKTETITLTPGQTRIFLEGYPVTEITSFTIDGTSVSSGDYVLSPWGVGDITVVGTPNLAPPVAVIAYKAGSDGADLAGVPAKLLRVVAREMNRTKDDTVGVRSLQTEGYATNYGSEAGGWLEEELLSLRRWKRRGAL